MSIEDAKRLLVFVAHPDDEVISCGVLLQRVPNALVVFAVDGAPAGYGFERKFGSLKNYSDERFKEASRALALARNCSLRRLQSPRGAHFPDRHLFDHLEAASDSLLTIAKEFMPDAIVAHAFEGGHLDHDACNVLASHTTKTLSLPHFEFPLYWKSEKGSDVFQQFRNPQDGEIIVNPSEAEFVIKNRMLAEYKSQRDIVAVFSSSHERFRPALPYDYSQPPWNSPYPGNWRNRRDARKALQRFAEFHQRSSYID